MADCSCGQVGRFPWLSTVVHLPACIRRRRALQESTERRAQ